MFLLWVILWWIAAEVEHGDVAPAVSLPKVSNSKGNWNGILTGTRPPNMPNGLSEVVVTLGLVTDNGAVIRVKGDVFARRDAADYKRKRLLVVSKKNTAFHNFNTQETFRMKKTKKHIRFLNCAELCKKTDLPTVMHLQTAKFIFFKCYFLNSSFPTWQYTSNVTVAEIKG